MIFFDISDKSIEAVRLSKSFFTGESINAFTRGEFEDGPVKGGEIQGADAFGKIVADLLETAKPKAMKDQECAFTLPDRRVYTRRLILPQRRDSQTVYGLIKAQAEKLIPQPIEELTYDYTIPDHKKKEGGEGEIFLAAVPTAIIDSYVKCFNDLGLEPRLAVPESLAAYTFLAPTIQADETVLYLDMGKSLSNAVLMDKWGVIEAFSEPIQTNKLFSQIGELLKFSRERIERKVSRIILGGGESLNIDIAKAKDEFKMEVTLIETAFESFRLPIRINFEGIPRIVFVNVLGLALLSKKEKPLNLIRA